MIRVLKQLNILRKRGSKLRLAADGWDKPWKTLIATILSARSRDDKTIVICNILFKKYSSLNKLAKSNLKDVQNIIRPINFYRNKSKSITNCAKMLVKEYKGNVPKDFDKLVKLPGVGRKTANVFLAVYGGSNIGVDTHVSYISQKLKWTKNKKPEKIEGDLERLFPKKYWRSINYVLVRFGRTYKRKKEKNKILEEIRKIK